MSFRRREPIHRRLAREGGLDPTRRPVAPGPRGVEVGIHGVARPREWDTVLAVPADLAGESARFVALPDGSIVIEEGPDDVASLAEAVERSLPAPYRAEAVRRRDGAWAVAAKRIQVMEIPDAEGDAIRVSVSPEGRQVEVDGSTVFGSAPALEALLDRDGVVTATRIDGDLWEVKVDRL
ncbi:MAG: hypothetical protein ACXVZ4_10675 [Gaiellaceae bacterium]